MFAKYALHGFNDSWRITSKTSGIVSVGVIGSPGDVAAENPHT
jgi:hypothetical protein